MWYSLYDYGAFTCPETKRTPDAEHASYTYKMPLATANPNFRGTSVYGDESHSTEI